MLFSRTHIELLKIEGKYSESLALAVPIADELLRKGDNDGFAVTFEHIIDLHMLMGNHKRALIEITKCLGEIGAELLGNIVFHHILLKSSECHYHIGILFIYSSIYIYILLF